MLGGRPLIKSGLYWHEYGSFNDNVTMVLCLIESCSLLKSIVYFLRSDDVLCDLPYYKPATYNEINKSNTLSVPSNLNKKPFCHQG